MHLNPGTLLQGGKYRIVRFIKSGGFGCTYEAVHTVLGSRIAIKEFFPKDFCNRDETTFAVTVGTQSKTALVAKLKRKFIDEAKVLHNLSLPVPHPGIVRVSDVFEENGTAYYVMDYIDGCSLDDVIKREGNLSEKDASAYIRQVCSALGYVHSRNCLHLDLKPGNIMIDTKGRAVLIDFGASKQYDEENGENTSSILGLTLGYAPVEQYRKDGVVQFSAATDIYALGATLYKMLSGNTPVDAVSRASGVSLSPLPENVSPSVRNAVYAAMKLHKEDRPQKVADLVCLLDGDITVNLGNNVDDGNKRLKEDTVKWIDVREFCERYKVRIPKKQPSKRPLWVLGIVLLIIIAVYVVVGTIVLDEGWWVGVGVMVIYPLLLLLLLFYLIIRSQNGIWKKFRHVYDVELHDGIRVRRNRKWSYAPFRVRNREGINGLASFGANGLGLLLQMEYDQIVKIDDSTFICRKGGLYGLYQGKWVLPLEYDMIEILPDNNVLATKGNSTYKFTTKGYRVVG